MRVSISLSRKWFSAFAPRGCQRPSAQHDGRQHCVGRPAGCKEHASQCGEYEQQDNARLAETDVVPDDALLGGSVSDHDVASLDPAGRALGSSVAQGGFCCVPHRVVDPTAAQRRMETDRKR